MHQQLQACWSHSCPMEASTLFLTQAAEEKRRGVFGNCFPKRNALRGWETLNYEIKEGEPCVILGTRIARYRNGIGLWRGAAGLRLCGHQFVFL